MIFKHYLNIATVIVAGTTYCAISAMSFDKSGNYSRAPGYIDLTDYIPEVGHTQLAVAAGNTAYPKNGFSQKITHSELTHYFQKPTQISKHIENNKQNRVPLSSEITKRSHKTSFNQHREWRNYLTTGEQLPKEMLDPNGLMISLQDHKYLKKYGIKLSQCHVKNSKTKFAILKRSQHS